MREFWLFFFSALKACNTSFSVNRSYCFLTQVNTGCPFKRCLRSAGKHRSAMRDVRDVKGCLVREQLCPQPRQQLQPLHGDMAGGT